MKYVLSEPYIKLEQKRNFLTFEENEQKRRSVLNRLFHEDWNYNHNWNTYYGYTFLNKDVLDYIMDEVPLHLDKYGISMEDPSLVSLNLAAAIMYHRVLSGHQLPPASPVLRPAWLPTVWQMPWKDSSIALSAAKNGMIFISGLPPDIFLMYPTLHH